MKSPLTWLSKAAFLSILALQMASCSLFDINSASSSAVQPPATSFRVTSATPSEGSLIQWPSSVVVQFSETPDINVAQDVNNYSVQCTGGGSFAVTAATASGTSVSLTLSRTSITTSSTTCKVRLSSALTSAGDTLSQTDLTYSAPSDIGLRFETNGDHAFIVPSGCTQLTAKLWGAGGGGSSGSSSSLGGGGGFASDTISVTPGETLNVLVGGGGLPGRNAAGFGTGGVGGGGRGGAGATSRYFGGGGGGRSAIQRSSSDLVTAGGGGGAGSTAGTVVGQGGPGGGSVNQSASTAVNCNGLRTGGVATGVTGGNGGTSSTGTVGGTGSGGGGGGGYAGGSGGDGTIPLQGGGCTDFGGAGGQGGTGFASINLAGSASTPANVADSLYRGTVGQGGVGGLTTTSTAGGDGLVVLTSCQ